MSGSAFTIGIVGGSIGGLAAAACLLRSGIDVTVFERAQQHDRALGAGLGVDLDLVARVTGARERGPSHLRLVGRRRVRGESLVDEPAALVVSAYHLLRDHLRASVPDERYVSGREVQSVDVPAEGALNLALAGGERRAFDAVVRADGARSRLPGLGAPADPPRYAGYTLIRGFVREASLPSRARAGLFDVPRLHVVLRGGHRLVAYPVPGERGEVAIGERRLNFGWYQGVSEERLRRELVAGAGDLAPGVPIQASRPEGAIADALSREAAAVWPEPYVAVVPAACEARALRIHPVYERAPDHLVADRVALVGDAAHLASPITGRGARNALLDALALEEAFARDPADVVSALRRYDAARHAAAVATVAHAHRAGAVLRDQS